MASQESLDRVQQLYVAYYGRPADQEGQTYWAERVDEEGEGAIINAFGNSEEYAALAEGQGNATLVNNVYLQAFGRDADPEGLAYYTGVLERGEKSLAEIATTIINAAGGIDKQTFDARVKAAAEYTAEFGGDDYDLEAAKAAIEAAKPGVDASALTEGLSNLADANTALADAEGSLVELLVEAEIIADADAFDPEALEDYADEAEVNVQNAISTLASARAGASDAAVEKAVTDAQADVNANELGNPTISETPSTTRYDAEGVQLVPLFFNAAAVDADKWKTQAELDAETPALTGYSLAGYQESGVGVTAPVGGTDTPANYAGFESTVFTARQLQQRVESAQATLASHEASNGATLELAGELNDAIALYEAAGGADLSGGELATIQTNYNAVVALVEEDGSVTTANQAAFDTAFGTWADSVSAAQDLITDETAPEELSDIGTRDNAVLSQLAVLDKRVELIAELDSREMAFEGGVGSVLTTAQAALDVRNGQIDDLATAQQQQASVTELTTAYEDAVAAVTAIEEELGYTVEKLDSGIEFATDEADLFTFDLADFTDEDGLVTLDSVIMNGVSTDDVLFFFGDYQLGTEGSADNNALELFFTEVNGNAVIQVEASAFGSQTDNFVEITLSGVSQDQLSFENGAVFIAEVA